MGCVLLYLQREGGLRTRRGRRVESAGKDRTVFARPPRHTFSPVQPSVAPTLRDLFHPAFKCAVWALHSSALCGRCIGAHCASDLVQFNISAASQQSRFLLRTRRCTSTPTIRSRRKWAGGGSPLRSRRQRPCPETTSERCCRGYHPTNSLSSAPSTQARSSSCPLGTGTPWSTHGIFYLF